MEWQPIETAPKDGTVCWLYSPDMDEGKGGMRGRYLASWRNGIWICNNGLHHKEMYGWVNELTKPYILQEVTFSHWMPLPPPPKEQNHEI